MQNQLLHTMIRVFDMDKSIDFYTRHLGMKLLRRKDYPSGEFTLAFVPKAVGVGIALLVCGHWMLQTIVSFTTQLYHSIPSLLG